MATYHPMRREEKEVFKNFLRTMQSAGVIDFGELKTLLTEVEQESQEYAEALKLLWSDSIAHASYHNPASDCKRFEGHFTEAENVFRYTEDGDYIEELVDVILPWEVD